MSISSEMTTDVVEISAVPSELGWFSFAIQQSRVLLVTIGSSSEFASRRRLREKLSKFSPAAETSQASSRLAARLGKDLQRFSSGEHIDFGEYDLFEADFTDFQQNVRNVVRRIPPGETLSYREVAEKAGSPGAARAVGNVMAKNRTPIVIPCHRVLASGGKWGGFTAPGGLDFKRRLLALESRN